MKDKIELIELSFEEIQKTKDLQFQIFSMKELLKNASSEAFLEENHKIQFNSIIIVTSGNGSHNIDLKKYECKKGTILFIAKNQLSSFSLNPPLEGFTIEFTDEFFSRWFPSITLDMFDYARYSPLLQLEENTLNLIIENIKLLTYYLDETKDEFKMPIVQSLFQSLLLQLKRKRVQGISPIKTKEEKVYNNFMQLLRSSHKYTMKVEDYARFLNISSKTLSRILLKYTKKPTKTYLNEYLILEIKRYLLDEEFTLQEIANKLQFDEITNLIKFFKRYEYITPIEFKKIYKN